MNSTSFKNFVPKLFQSAEERERRALERIERQRNDRERQKGIALRAASLTDAIESARERFAVQCKRLEEAAEFSPEQFAGLYLAGHKLEELALRLAGAEKLKSNLPQIKAELERLIVSVAERALADFQKENKDVLAKLPKLERATEPKFIPAQPVNDGAVIPEPPSAGVRLMLNLRKGEMVAQTPPFDNAKPASGGGFNDDDED